MRRRTSAPRSHEPRGLLPYCKWVADRKGHAEWYFRGSRTGSRPLPGIDPRLLKNMKLDLPLVIADEAHHWRHSQRQDCQAFRRYLAPLARRLLLLTATPSSSTGTSCWRCSPQGTAWSPRLVLTALSRSGNDATGLRKHERLGGSRAGLFARVGSAGRKDCSPGLGIYRPRRASYQPRKIPVPRKSRSNGLRIALTVRRRTTRRLCKESPARYGRFSPSRPTPGRKPVSP